MKILSPSEYKKQNKDAYLNDYVTYLEEKQQEIEIVMESAKFFALSESVLFDIEKQSEEIMNILIVIEKYTEQIILNSIDTLSLSELQSYFESLNDFDNRREKANKKKARLRQKLLIINGRIEENLYQNGRKKEFYQVDDVEEFFKENMSREQLLGNVLSDNTLETLEIDFKEVVKMEGEFQQVILSDDKIEYLWLEFVGLIEKCKKILGYSEESKDQLIKILLSEKGIGQIFNSEFHENTYMYIVDDLLNLSKIRTKFYQGLPSELQKKLLTEGFKGDIYQELYATYQSIKNGEELETDFNKKELLKKAKVEKLLEGIEYTLTSIDAEEKCNREFLSDREAMISILKSKMIAFFKENQISLNFVNEIIEDTEEKLGNYKLKLLEKLDLFLSKTKKLKLAQRILLNPSYHSFFEDVELLNKRKLYQAMGVNATEKVIEPFLLEEKRRFEQIYIIVNMQQELEKIYDMIRDKKEHSNFITKRLPSYKEELKTLETTYQVVKEKAFQELQEKNLFQVNAPCVKSNIALGTIEVLPSRALVEIPSTFEELCKLSQTFWDMSIEFDTNTQNRFLADQTEFENWSDYIYSLMYRQGSLVCSLFNYCKDQDGYYRFNPPENREELLKVQARIVAIADFACKERIKFKQEMEEKEISLDSRKVEELEAILGKNSNLSRDALALYIENAKQELKELTIFLAQHQEDYSKLGIMLPNINGEAKEPSVSKYDELEARMKLLHIDEIETLEDAKCYRNLLLELNEYTVPKEDIKTFYLKHRKEQ